MSDELAGELRRAAYVDLSDIRKSLLRRAANEIERLTRENTDLLEQVKYWQRSYWAAQEELIVLRDKMAAQAAGGDDDK